MPSAVKNVSFIYNPLAARMLLLVQLLLLKGYSYPYALNVTLLLLLFLCTQL